MPALPRLASTKPWHAGGALALVSGRPIGEVDRLTSPHRFPASGIHGLERRSAVGGYARATASDPGALAAAAGVLRGLSQRHPQLLLEDKVISLALHYREAPQLKGVLQSSIEAIPGVVAAGGVSKLPATGPFHQWGVRALTGRIATHLRDQGVGVLYISHRLEEVFSLCDRVTVLKDGKLVGTAAVAIAVIQAIIVVGAVVTFVATSAVGQFGRLIGQFATGFVFSPEKWAGIGVTGGLVVGKTFLGIGFSQYIQ